ncbi:hypothetical protein LguiB_000944 [Lonicera macranthoides]
MTGGSKGPVRMVYGDRSELGYYNHASILINVQSGVVISVFFLYFLDIPFDFGGAASCISHPHQRPHNNNNKDTTTNNNRYHPTNVDLEIN